MKIPLSFARLLQKMLLGESINHSSFQGTSRKLLTQFDTDGVLDYVTIGSQQKKVWCPDSQKLLLHLHHKFGVSSLDNYISFLEKEETTRSEAVRATSNSKFRKTRVMEGFLVNSYEEINIALDGQGLRIAPRQGILTFIHDFKKLTIPEDITVVGVEGHENFKSIAGQRYLFKGLKPLFLWRYQNSTSIARWLKTIPNPYLHFGDFDLKGLHIYISEFRRKIDETRCKFLIPENLESLMLDFGEQELYDKQVQYLREVDFESIPEIAEVLKVIRKYKKGLAQEVLIL